MRGLRGTAARQEACRPAKQIRAAVIALAILWPPLALADDFAHVTIRGDCGPERRRELG